MTDEQEIIKEQRKKIYGFVTFGNFISQALYDYGVSIGLLREIFLDKKADPMWQYYFYENPDDEYMYFIDDEKKEVGLNISKASHDAVMQDYLKKLKDFVADLEKEVTEDENA